MSSAAEVYRRKQEAKAYMLRHADEYETCTELAEACANDQNLYEDHRSYTIPEWVYDLAVDCKPEK